MTRILALLSSAALLAAAANAQCLQAPTGTSIAPGMLQWSSGSGYTSTFPIDDEGITSPPIAFTAFTNFPMAGAVGNLDQMWVNSNGEIYLTDSTLALTQPAGGASFGVDSLAEMRGANAADSARIAVFGDDQEASVLGGAAWDILVDQTIPGQVRVYWQDVTRYADTSAQYSFSCTLYASGAVQMEYGTLPFLTDIRYVGISIGNGVGTTSSPSYNLSGLPDSGTEGLLFEAFGAANACDLSGKSMLINPNGTGGYTAVVTCEPATNVTYGTGCHTFPATTATGIFAEQFLGSPAAKTALDGNAVQYSIAGSGYNVSWLPGTAGALFVPPVTPTLTGLGDDATLVITPSAAAPLPGGGTATTWTIGSNGQLTAGSVGNQGTDYTPTLAEMGTATGLAFYCWRDWNPAEAGSGPIVWEEIGGILYVTWNGVEAYGTPSPNPGTFQYQVDLTTGDVRLVVVSFEASTSTANVIVGVNLAGASPTPTSSTLSLGGSATPEVALTPMTLSASPAPVINPSTVVTYTLGNVYEFQPASGVRLATMFLSVNPLPGGFDLAGILTSVPGCNAYIATLDLDLGAQVTVGNPTMTWNFTYDNVSFSPGNVIAAQGVCLFDGSFPLANGENGGFILSNGVLSTTQLQ